MENDTFTGTWFAETESKKAKKAIPYLSKQHRALFARLYQCVCGVYNGDATEEEAQYRRDNTAVVHYITTTNLEREVWTRDRRRITALFVSVLLNKSNVVVGYNVKFSNELWRLTADFKVVVLPQDTNR